MSTLNTYNLKSPDSANTNLALDASGNVAIQAGSASAPSIYVTGDVNTGLYSPGADQVAVTTGGTARLFVDASGRLLVGTSSSIAVGVINSKSQIEFTDYDASQTIKRNSNGDGGPQTIYVKSRGTSNGSNTVVQNGDSMGQFRFYGTDGTSPIEGASINAAVDGTPGTNDMPGRLVFSTTADGASSPTERMRVTSAGLVGIGTASPTVRLETVGSASILGATNVCARFSDNTNSTFAIGHPTGGGVDLIGNAGLNFCTSDGTTKSERARIDSSGRLLVGTSTGSAQAVINGSLAVGSTCIFTKSSGASPLVFTVTWGQSGQAAGMFTLRAAQSNYSSAYGGSGEWVYRFIGAAVSNVAALRSSTDGTAPTVTVTNVSGTSFTVSVAFSFQQCFADISVMGATNIS